MGKKVFYLILMLITVCCLTSCILRTKHADVFYNYDDFAMSRIPLINPIEIHRLNSSYPWAISFHPCIYVDFPGSQGHYYAYCRVNELEKFAVKNGVIMAYTMYINKEADVYIQDNFYYWFVTIPDKEITEGFHTEDEFLEYIQTLGIEEIDWQIPDEARKQFRKTGCLEWFPDCE